MCLLILLSRALEGFMVETHSFGPFQPQAHGTGFPLALFTAPETLKLDMVYFLGSEDLDPPVRAI